ncbi:AI-2E family transporter [Nocardioides sp. MAH-18]|uniref:AI-2E family transporter n=1 Tax=Nocardioides agri TaxID=2682843 RepID=A0A6L6XMD4_9ACTN|nr:AI-2E family transporter [Nocardioides sp. CGMCC 1.13656]MBA2956582.1 AI-2E family transporter [Nocardioides sp. CGMCC 1.13656]MVQ47726.1 AI-2E family transporter [Nocardioides sp. MAH-18]
MSEAPAPVEEEPAAEGDGGIPTGDEYLGEPGPPLDRHAPFYVGFFGGAGVLLAIWLAMRIQAVGSTLMLIVVALFLAAGLNPSVEFFERRGMRRSYAVITVILAFLAALTLFLVAIVPVIADQVRTLTENAPEWFAELQRNRQVQRLDDEYDIIDKVQDYVTGGDFLSAIFGGAVGVGLAVLGALFNGFIIIVLTLYFLASLQTTKAAIYRLAPASRRDRVGRLGDRIVRSVGGYVSGAFLVAMCAGISSLVFLFVAGLGQYAVALAFVVALLDVIPMIGATIGAVIVTAIAFATDWKIGVACLIFYVIYQQVENYVIYPRVMSKSVDVPGAVTVIAALVGAALFGVVGALLAIPTAASILMLVREVWVRRQDQL